MLEPGEAVTVSYPFFHLIVVVQSGSVQKLTLGRNVQWTETVSRGDVSWKEPMPEMTKTNVGSTTYVEYIAEWR